MMSDIDDDFYLSMKPWSWVWTFSLDFAIWIKWWNTINNLPTKEIWRTGIDTQKIKEIISMRIIRTWWAIKKSNWNFEEKSDMYKLFKKKYGLSPQRALAFLVMYIWKDLKVDEIKAISLIWARQKKLNLIWSKQINFDYTELFKNVWFKETSNPNWLSLGNPKETFYDTLETSPEDLKWLRAYETSWLDKIINAFKNLRDIVDPNKKCPLEICADETKEEIEKAMNTFRKIHNK